MRVVLCHHCKANFNWLPITFFQEVVVSLHIKMKKMLPFICLHAWFAMFLFLRKIHVDFLFLVASALPLLTTLRLCNATWQYCGLLVAPSHCHMASSRETRFLGLYDNYTAACRAAISLSKRQIGGYWGSESRSCCAHTAGFASPCHQGQTM